MNDLPRYFDLHSHILCGVDDGAENEETMFRMIDMAYEDGTRALCLTPHYAPQMFDENTEPSAKVFETLKAYAAEKYPDLTLYLGHELGYHFGCLKAIDEGKCRTVAGSRYVLVDFPETVSYFDLQSAIDTLWRGGYGTVLAHAERYRCLDRHIEWLEDYYDRGGVIQLNASSANGGWGMRAKHQWKKLMKLGLAHIIASDGHNLSSRPPKISVCMEYLQKHCSPEDIEALTWSNAARVVENKLF